MTQESSDKDQNDGEQHPPDIPPEDWANTPISVRKLVTSLLATKQEDRGEPENRFPILIIFLINLVIVVGLTNYFEGKVTFPCVTPHEVSPLSVSIISLISLHLIWRNVYAFIPSNIKETINVGIITIPLTAIITFFNEMQLWKLPSRLLGLLLLFLLIAGAFLNLSAYSPFYTPDELSAIQGFSIQRFDTKLVEGLPIGGRLSITANEKVLVEAVFRNKAETTCTWYSALSSQASQTGCSIVLDEVSRTGPDTLTVLIQSACGTQDFAGLNVVVLP